MDFQEIIHNVCSNLAIKRESKENDIILILSFDNTDKSFSFNWAFIFKIDEEKEKYLNVHFRVLAVPMIDTCWKITTDMLNGKETFILDNSNIRRFIIPIEKEPDPEFDLRKIDKNLFVANTSKMIH